MLPKINRLPSREIRRVMQAGRKEATKDRITFSLKNGLPVSRFAIIVGARVAARAVVRNSIKRRLSESVRLSLANEKPGFDTVILLR